MSAVTGRGSGPGCGSESPRRRLSKAVPQHGRARWQGEADASTLPIWHPLTSLLSLTRSLCALLCHRTRQHAVGEVARDHVPCSSSCDKVRMRTGHSAACSLSSPPKRPAGRPCARRPPRREPYFERAAKSKGRLAAGRIRVMSCSARGMCRSAFSQMGSHVSLVVMTSVPSLDAFRALRPTFTWLGDGRCGKQKTGLRAVSTE
jgi:hypothetical protein